jgi:hypothetical protein
MKDLEYQSTLAQTVGIPAPPVYVPKENEEGSFGRSFRAAFDDSLHSGATSLQKIMSAVSGEPLPAGPSMDLDRALELGWTEDQFVEYKLNNENMLDYERLTFSIANQQRMAESSVGALTGGLAGELLNPLYIPTYFVGAGFVRTGVAGTARLVNAGRSAPSFRAASALRQSALASATVAPFEAIRANADITYTATDAALATGFAGVLGGTVGAAFPTTSYNSWKQFLSRKALRDQAVKEGLTPRYYTNWAVRQRLTGGESLGVTLFTADGQVKRALNVVKDKDGNSFQEAVVLNKADEASVAYETADGSLYLGSKNTKKVTKKGVTEQENRTVYLSSEASEFVQTAKNQGRQVSLKVEQNGDISIRIKDGDEWLSPRQVTERDPKLRKAVEKIFDERLTKAKGQQQVTAAREAKMLKNRRARTSEFETNAKKEVPARDVPTTKALENKAASIVDEGLKKGKSYSEIVDELKKAVNRSVKNAGDRDDTLKKLLMQNAKNARRFKKEIDELLSRPVQGDADEFSVSGDRLITEDNEFRELFWKSLRSVTSNVNNPAAVNRGTSMAMDVVPIQSKVGDRSIQFDFTGPARRVTRVLDDPDLIAEAYTAKTGKTSSDSLWSLKTVDADGNVVYIPIDKIDKLNRFAQMLDQIKLEKIDQPWLLYNFMGKIPYAKALFQSGISRVLASKNPVFQKFLGTMFEDSSRHINNISGEISQHRMKQVVMAKFRANFASYHQLWRNAGNKGGRREFERAVAKTVRAQADGVKSSDQVLSKAAEDFSNAMEALREFGVHTGLGVGDDALPAGYVPRFYQWDSIRAAINAKGESNVRELLTRSLASHSIKNRLAGKLDDATKQKIQNWIDSPTAKSQELRTILKDAGLEKEALVWDSITTQLMELATNTGKFRATRHMAPEADQAKTKTRKRILDIVGNDEEGNAVADASISFLFGETSDNPLSMFNKRLSLDENLEWGGMSMSDMFVNDLDDIMEVTTKRTFGASIWRAIGQYVGMDIEKGKVQSMDELVQFMEKNGQDLTKNELNTLNMAYADILGFSYKGGVLGKGQEAINANTDIFFARMSKFLTALRMVTSGITQTPESVSILTNSGVRASLNAMQDHWSLFVPYFGKRAYSKGQVRTVAQELESVIEVSDFMDGRMTKNMYFDFGVGQFGDRASKANMEANADAVLDGMLNLSLRNPIGILTVENRLRVLAASAAAHRFARLATSKSEIKDSFWRSNRSRLISMGLTDKDISDLQVEFSSGNAVKYRKGKFTGQRLMALNLENWKDQGLADRFAVAMQRMVNQQIHRPNMGEFSPWMNTPVGRIIMQFRRFMHTSVNSYLHYNSKADIRDAQGLGIVVFGSMMGILQWHLRKLLVLSGIEDEERREKYIKYTWGSEDGKTLTSPASVLRGIQQSPALGNWFTVGEQMARIAGLEDVFPAGGGPMRGHEQMTAEQLGPSVSWFYNNLKNAADTVRGIKDGLSGEDPELKENFKDFFENNVPFIPQFIRTIPGINNYYDRIMN